MKPIGEKLSPILEEIENTLWEFDANVGDPPKYSTEGFRAAIKIFMSVLMDKMWDVQEFDKMDMKDRINMVEAAGKDVRALVRKYTGIDTHTLY